MKIETVYTMKQPLSHIGESESTASFLNTIRLVCGSKVKEVFALTGNAIRGTLRDCAARDLLRRLGVKVGKKEFNILFSGGNISGTMTTDVDQAKAYRDLLPMISVFGAGVGNQILAGKMTMGFALPVCDETKDIIPQLVAMDWELTKNSWKSLTGVINFTRFDDTKNVNYRDFLNAEKDGTEKDSATTQMRYEVEYLVPGSQLYHVINFSLDNDDRGLVELGAFVAALKEFSKSPILGGMGGKGFGLCDAEVYMDGSFFCRIEDGDLWLEDEAQRALDAYEQFVADNVPQICEFLGATK